MSLAKNEIIKRLPSLLDLTRLIEHDTEQAISHLCSLALEHSVAAVCLYPNFVTLARTLLHAHPIKIATVANFPRGDAKLTDVISEIATAINSGADEIDVVMPYRDYLQGKRQAVCDFISACKDTCLCTPLTNTICLKVIIETSALQQPHIIAQATRDMIIAGADFIKTSTGKHSHGADLTTARIILETISHTSEHLVGFKAAGGIRSRGHAMEYSRLAEDILGSDYLQTATFRIGTSSIWL